MTLQLSCKYCGKQFTGRTKWQQYCSDRCRNQYWIESNPRARLEIKSPLCYYCGAPSDTIDHVPPRVARNRLTELGLQDKYKFIEVNCCHECNCALGTRALWTLPERKRFIKRYLQRRYKKYIRKPDWSGEELNKLGEVLRKHVSNSIIIRDIIRNRLKW